jgi:hypothetical protein
MLRDVSVLLGRPGVAALAKCKTDFGNVVMRVNCDYVENGIQLTTGNGTRLHFFYSDSQTAKLWSYILSCKSRRVVGVSENSVTVCGDDGVSVVFTGVTERQKITYDECDGSCEFLVNLDTVRKFDALECWYGGLVMKFSYDTLSTEYFLKTASGLIWDVPFTSQSIMSKICNQGRCFMIDIDDGRMRLCQLGLDDAAVLNTRKSTMSSTRSLMFDSRDEISKALAKLDVVAR